MSWENFTARFLRRSDGWEHPAAFPLPFLHISAAPTKKNLLAVGNAFR